MASTVPVPVYVKGSGLSSAVLKTVVRAPAGAAGDPGEGQPARVQGVAAGHFITKMSTSSLTRWNLLLSILITGQLPESSPCQQAPGCGRQRSTQGMCTVREDRPRSRIRIRVERALSRLIRVRSNPLARIALLLIVLAFCGYG